MGETYKRSYYSDASHNYLVLACPQELRDNYQYKMLAANRIRGLLPCSGRSIDNQEYLYYDITSRQSMADIFDRRPVRGADLQRFLEELARIEETLTEYLLDTSHMILDPACIYVDFREQEWSFAYYPGEAQEDGWEPLFSFFADRVDGKDKQAAALAYRLCMMAQRPGFVMRRELLEELGIRMMERKSEYSGSYGRNTGAPRGEYRQQSVLSSRNAGPLGEGRNGAPEAGYYGYGNTTAPKNGDMDTFRGPEGSRTGRSGPEGAGSLPRADAVPESYGKNTPGKSAGKERTAFRAETQTEDPGGGRSGGGKGRCGSGRGGNGRGRWKPAVGGCLLLIGIFLCFLDRLVSLAEREMILARAAGVLMAGTGALLLIIQIIRKAAGRDSRVPDGQAEEDGASGPPCGNPVFEKEMPPFGCGADDPYAEAFYGGGIFEGRGRLYEGGLCPERSDAGGFYKGGFCQGGQDEGGFYVGRTFAERSCAEGSFAAGPGPARKGQTGVSAMPDIAAGAASTAQGTAAVCGETSLLHPGTEPAAGLYGTGTFRGEQIRLDSLPCVVGKAGDYVDQVLEDSSVSRMHARFSMEQDGKMTLRDLNSTNGTWLNGERLRPNESRMIQPGDLIRMGRMEFVYR